MGDWTEHDISGIPEEAFPIRCDRCSYLLTGLGDSGRCPQCAWPFVRRKRLWETYGPEAFAEPPIPGVDQPDASFVFALLTAVGLTLLLPAILLAWYELFGKFDLGFGLFVWLVVLSAAVWIVVARRHAKSEPTEPEDEAPDS